MGKIVSWIAGILGGLLLMYAVCMVIVGELVVAQNHTAFFQEKLHTGLSITYDVALCGAVLVTLALAVAFATGRRGRNQTHSETH